MFAKEAKKAKEDKIMDDDFRWNRSDAENHWPLYQHVNFANWTGITGCISDRHDPQTPIALELSVGDTLQAMVSASKYRDGS